MHKLYCISGLVTEDLKVLLNVAIWMGTLDLFLEPGLFGAGGCGDISVGPDEASGVISTVYQGLYLWHGSPFWSIHVVFESVRFFFHQRLTLVIL